MSFRVLNERISSFGTSTGSGIGTQSDKLIGSATLPPTTIRKLCKSLGKPVENIITPLVDSNNNNVGELVLTLTLTPLDKNNLTGASSTLTTDNTAMTVTEGIFKIKKIVVHDVVGNELLGGKDALYVRVAVDDWQVLAVPLSLFVLSELYPNPALTLP